MVVPAWWCMDVCVILGVCVCMCVSVVFVFFCVFICHACHVCTAAFMRNELNNKVRDLGVIVDSKLSFSDHITEKVNKAYSILGIARDRRNTGWVPAGDSLSHQGRVSNG